MTHSLLVLSAFISVDNHASLTLSILMYETKNAPLLGKAKFAWKMLRRALFSIFLIGFCLGIGIVGYHYIEHIAWIDSLLNASMILTGMGPVSLMKTDAGKIFASFYALFSGVAFLTIVAIFFGPIFHRFLHKFHVDTDKS